ncbi:MAG: MBL fold metallo-hydrolase [Thermoplasmata archaeon]|nr:MAG: MBL fold metallo-hydrolase [Thermoplasmata archaeon]
MNPMIILPGVLVRDSAGNILDASSTVTLIRSEDKGNILIDTGEPSRRLELLSALKKKAGMVPADINFLVVTHSHIDHVGNNELFVNANILAHKTDFLGRGGKCFGITLIKEGYVISEQPRAYVIETPGHTRGSISVIVESDKIYAITGDALPIEDNYKQWVPPGINIDPALAIKSMERIVKIADVIIPGHDNMFEINRS